MRILNIIETAETSELEASYNRLARKYADEFGDELTRKPFDREILDRFAASVHGPVYDIGCGPGHIARYLKDRGVDVHGIDLSAEMVKQARRLNPDIPITRGDMLALDLSDAAGIVSLYSIIHLRREDAPRALHSMRCALEAGGRLLLSFHGGEGTIHRDEWFELPVSIDLTLFERDEMTELLERAGFRVEEVLERPPYPFEYQTRRVFAFATAP